MADKKSCEDEMINKLQRELDDQYGPGSCYKNHDKPKKALTLDVDFSNALTGLKAVQREAKKASSAIKELESLTKDKYLVIELDKLGDEPKVFYKGEEITLKEFIGFQWTTKSDVPGNTDVIIDYFQKDDNKLPVNKSIREGISS